MLRAWQEVQGGGLWFGIGWIETPGLSVCAAGGCWVARCSFSLAFRRQHVLGSPVQLQGRDGADVFGELGFPPHQRPLPPLLLLDLRGGSERFLSVH